MIFGLQIVSLAFSLVMIYFAVLHYRRKELNNLEIAIWLGVWSFAIITIIFPDLLKTFAKEFKFARLFDMMVVGGLILVIAMVSKAYVATKRMEKKLEDYVRKEALKDVKKTKKQ